MGDARNPFRDAVFASLPNLSLPQLSALTLLEWPEPSEAAHSMLRLFMDGHWLDTPEHHIAQRNAMDVIARALDQSRWLAAKYAAARAVTAEWHRRLSVVDAALQPTPTRKRRSKSQ